MSEKLVNSARDQSAKTPGKYIEVYKLRGVLPEHWLEDDQASYSGSKYLRQVHFVCFYNDGRGNKNGITLYRGLEKENPYKALKRDDIFGRACGWGGVEELFEAQTWTNYSEIHIQKMLRAASLIVLQTSDRNYATRNTLADLEKAEILTYQEGSPLTQVNIQPQNINDFRNNTTLWEQQARTVGSASDPQLGLNPSSGTPLGTTQIVTGQGFGIHDYRRGKLATFIEEIYHDWVLPGMVKEMNGGQKFLDTLSLEELEYVADKLAVTQANEKIKEIVLGGDTITPDQVAFYKKLIKDSFKKGGNKKFLEILKDDLKDLPVRVQVNVAGKQKNLASDVDKLSRLFQFMISVEDPKRLQVFGKLFNEIIEGSGLSPVDFSEFTDRPDVEAPEMEPVGEVIPTETEEAGVQPVTV